MNTRVVCALAVTLGGCASTGGWRALQIDGGSLEAFDESVAVFMEELPYARRDMFAFALADIWYSELSDAALRDERYGEEQFAARLDGLTYEEVIEIADAEEPGISDYYSRRNRNVGSAGRRPPPGWGFSPPGSSGIVVYPGVNGIPRPGGAN